jgi:hypothetical protein
VAGHGIGEGVGADDRLSPRVEKNEIALMKTNKALFYDVLG